MQEYAAKCSHFRIATILETDYLPGGISALQKRIIKSKIELLELMLLFIRNTFNRLSKVKLIWKEIITKTIGNYRKC